MRANKKCPVKSHFGVFGVQRESGVEEDNNQSLEPWPSSIKSISHRQIGRHEETGLLSLVLQPYYVDE